MLDRQTLGPVLQLRKPVRPHRWIDYRYSRQDQVVERLRGATIAVTNKVPISAEEMASLPDLRFTAVAATGTDMIDRVAAEVHGITVLNVGAMARGR